MKVVVAAFNQGKALVGAFSVIVQLHRLIVYSTSLNLHQAKDGMTMNILGVSALAGGSCSCDQCSVIYEAGINNRARWAGGGARKL